MMDEEDGSDQVTGEGEEGADLFGHRRSGRAKKNRSESKGEGNKEEGAEEFSGDSPAEEEEWDGGDSQSRDFDSRTKRVGWRRSSRLMKDTQAEAAGKGEEEEDANDASPASSVGTEGVAGNEGVQKKASNMDEESDDERVSERVIEDMLKMRNSKAAGTSKR